MKTFPFVVLALLAVSVNAQARANYPILDMHRANFGFSVGVHSLGEEDALAIAGTSGPKRFGTQGGFQAAYSTGPAIAIGGGADYSPSFKIGRANEAINWAIASDGVGAGLQLFARVGLVQYYGDNWGSILSHEVDGETVSGKQSSWEVALPLSWRLHANKGGNTAWYIGIDPRIDMRNKYSSIIGRLQLGWTPEPPQ